jgi:type III secretion protein N (ATPase)
MTDKDAVVQTEKLSQALRALDHSQTMRSRGRITELIGLVLRAAVPGVRRGDLVEIEKRDASRLPAEVVGFRGAEVILVPFGEVEGVGPDSAVIPTGRQMGIRCSAGLVGRVLGGLGEPLDDRGPLDPPGQWRPIRQSPPDPLKRPRIERPLALGIRAIDGLLTVGEGQRVGVFAGSGVGKSTLLGQIARNTSADVNVICLVGERGREVREFIEEALGAEGLRRSVVICATSDEPAFVRLTCAQVATTVAEYLRDCGKRVLLLMDSVTRFARAQREVGLAAGEPPARRGFPPSVFAALPRLLERTGTAPKGSITALYTVLVEGGDMEEPIADEVRGILDGHIVLSRELAARNHYPAIDVLHSLSRVMNAVTDETHQRAAAVFRKLLAAYECRRDLIALGAYKKGSEPEVDRALDKLDGLLGFLQQKIGQRVMFDEVVRALVELTDG